ncbi:helix-turn-helix transcriptional regulator [Rhodovibrionaceae bacterium A322]
MKDPMLLSLPLPMISSLLCGLLALMIWRLDLGTLRAKFTFTLLFALCALETFLVGIRFGYGVVDLIPLQRSLPLFLGPLMYLGFASLTLDRPGFRRIAFAHLIAPFVALGLFWQSVGDLRQLDWLISASYLFYLCVLFQLWRKGPDALTHARLEAAGSLSDWLLRLMGLLAFVLLMDSLIALDFALHRGANVPGLISYGTLPLLVILLIILLTIPRLNAPRAKAKPSVVEGTEQDRQVMAQLAQMMEQEQLYLDPNITVQRLARRLHLPSKTLSSAVNRSQNKNVSQYVNDLRLAHAARLLTEQTDSVTKVAEQSGFLTRSNFYREFQRLYGQSPSQFRAGQAGTGP